MEREDEGAGAGAQAGAAAALYELAGVVIHQVRGLEGEGWCWMGRGRIGVRLFEDVASCAQCDTWYLTVDPSAC